MTGSLVNGWCSTPAHQAAGDHILGPDCTDPVPESVLMAELRAEARKHDQHVTYSREAAYVAQHRPY